MAAFRAHLVGDDGLNSRLQSIVEAACDSLGFINPANTRREPCRLGHGSKPGVDWTKYIIAGKVDQDVKPYSGSDSLEEWNRLFYQEKSDLRRYLDNKKRLELVAGQLAAVMNGNGISAVRKCAPLLFNEVVPLELSATRKVMDYISDRIWPDEHCQEGIEEGLQSFYFSALKEMQSQGEYAQDILTTSCRIGGKWAALTVGPMKQDLANGMKKMDAAMNSLGAQGRQALEGLPQMARVLQVRHEAIEALGGASQLALSESS